MLKGSVQQDDMTHANIYAPITGGPKYVKQVLVDIKGETDSSAVRVGDVKDLYAETCKTLKKEIEEDTNKWKHVPCSWAGRINNIKMSILPKAFCRFSEVPIKIPMVYFITRTDIPKIYMKPQSSPNNPQ